MKRNHGPPVEGTASFHTTRWTIVMRAAQSRARGGESALAEMCQLYAYPLSIFARPRGYSPEDAQDLTQGVFLHPEDRVFGGFDPLNCKFRSILLASLRRHAPVCANDRIVPFAHDGLASRLELSIGGASL